MSFILEYAPERKAYGEDLRWAYRHWMQFYIWAVPISRPCATVLVR